MQQDFDIIIATDLRLPGGSSSSTAEEIKAQHRAGYKTGLLHIPNPAMKKGRAFNEKIVDCLRLGYVDLVEPEYKFKAKLIIIRNPKGVEYFNNDSLSYTLEHCLIVGNGPSYDKNGHYYDIPKIDKIAQSRFTSYEWAPIGPLVRDQFEEYKDSIIIRDRDWSNIIDVGDWTNKRDQPIREIPVIGRVSRDQYMKWPENRDDIIAAYPIDKAIDVKVLGGAKTAFSVLEEIPSNWHVYPYGSVTAQAFLKEIDFFVYFHHSGLVEAFGRVILEALASGVVVILPSHFKPLFGDSCIYATPKDVRSIVNKYHSDWSLYQEQSKKAYQFAVDNFSYELHLTRLEEIIGKPNKRRITKTKHKSKTSITKKGQTVLFMSSNGSGVGHLTRLMAMARRSSHNITPIFLTLSQAVKVVEESGFFVEYLPSNSYLNGESSSSWHQLLEQRLNEIYDTHQPDAIVFDGTYPYKGLMSFIKEHPEIKSVWSRRAMWKKTSEELGYSLAELSQNFSLVIEPGDLSESADTGATVAERHNAYIVDPVTYLDKKELLSKNKARATLELPQDKIIGLIQLGAGNINDTSSIINNLLSVYRGVPNLIICVTKSAIANQDVSEKFPNLVGISHYPLSELLNAFDFAIGAAGYNSFHEFINFGIPTLIIPNVHAKLDSAINRVSYVESRGALLVALEDDIEDIKTKASSLLNTETRKSLKENMDKIKRPNGAAKAMSRIEKLILESEK